MRNGWIGLAEKTMLSYKENIRGKMKNFKAAGKKWKVVPQLMASMNDNMSQNAGRVIGYTAFPASSTGNEHPSFNWTPKMSQEDLDTTAQQALDRHPSLP